MLAILLCVALGDFAGDCVEVLHGDTIVVVSDDGERITVNLHGVAAPQRRQPHGYEASFGLASLCFNKRVSVIEKDRDRDGRILALVLCEGIDLGVEQIALGNAWQDPRFSTCRVMRRYQESAKLLNRGLWAKSKPAEPRFWKPISPR